MSENLSPKSIQEKKVLRKEKIEPTLEIFFEGSKIQFFGKPNDFQDLKNKYPTKLLIENLANINISEEIKKIVAPYPISNKIIEFDSNDKTFDERTFEIKRENGSEITIFRGENADANVVIISKENEAHIFAPADCLLGVICFEFEGSKKIMSCHISLNSLLPFQGEKSLVLEIKEYFEKNNLDKNAANIFFGFAIPKNKFIRDLQFAGKQEENAYFIKQIKSLGIQIDLKDNRYFEVDIQEIAERLFKIAGFENITQKQNTNPDLFWSNFSPEKEENKNNRNLIVVSFE